MPEVSIIIPVYNNEKYIEKCIHSVLNQTFGELEIIAVNDGSTDESGKILKNLEREDVRIILLEQNNQGVAAARNLGVKKSTGKYITFVDGDDYLKNDYIEKMYDLAEKESLDMVISGLTYVDESGKELNKIIPGVYKRLENEEWTFRISAVCSHLYRRELWTKYDVQECGYYYVQHASSAIHNFKGLEKYSLPYKGLNHTLAKVQKIGIVNSPEFFELFALRIFSTCLFQLAPGASKVKTRELCNYIENTVNRYFPHYWRNSKARLTVKADIPFSQKVAVRVLMILMKTRLLHPFGWLISNKK